jgi:nitrous oxidase accessory protein
MILLLALAHAGEHDAAAPASIAVAEVVAVEGAPRTVVVESGEDLGAILATLPPHSVIRLRAGTHTGPIRIDRALDLSGDPGAVIDGGGKGTVIIVAAPDVSLHDLRVTGGGFQRQDDDSGIVIGADRFRVERVVVDHAYLGIDVRMAKDGLIQDCRVLGDPDAPFGMRGDGIRLWEADDNRVIGNTLEHVRDLVIWYSDGNLLQRNTVVRSRYGTHFMHAERNTVQDSIYDDDVVGVFVMYSDGITLSGNRVRGAHGEAGIGFGFKESSDIHAEGNVLVDDTTGIYLDTTPHDGGTVADFRNNLIGGNERGLRFHGRCDGATFTANDLASNRSAAVVDAHVSTEAVTFEGNHWTDYEGYDLDGDGFGDLPFEARELSGSLTERRPSLAYFRGTLADGLLGLLARAFPMFAPSPVLVDRHPAMRGGPS